MMFALRALLLAFVLLVKPTLAATQEPLVVFAAASLTDTLQKATDAYTRQTGQAVKLSFAATSGLARQIEAGARADVFFSADQEWMDYLEQRQLIDSSSRADLLGNRLVLIAPQDSKLALKLGPDAPVLAALGPGGRLATGDPDSVPAGKYAKAAFTTLGMWSALEPRLARAENVRVALSYVARGEAPLGVVYATDARVEPRVRIVDLFPANSHAPITYPAALTKTAAPSAAAYLKFLRGAEAAAIFRSAGFEVLAVDAQASAANCTGFKFDLSRELKLFGGESRPAKAATNVDAATVLQSDTLYRVTLPAQAATRFAAPVGKATVAEGSYAGLFRIAPNAARTVRVTLNEAAWIDVVDSGRALQSTRHTGAHDCAVLRKSVEFEVRPNTPLVLQLSGSTAADILVAITR